MKTSRSFPGQTMKTFSSIFTFLNLFYFLLQSQFDSLKTKMNGNVYSILQYIECPKFNSISINFLEIHM
jgi:hypothetical protein